MQDIAGYLNFHRVLQNDRIYFEHILVRTPGTCKSQIELALVYVDVDIHRWMEQSCSSHIAKK